MTGRPTGGEMQHLEAQLEAEGRGGVPRRFRARSRPSLDLNTG